MSPRRAEKDFVSGLREDKPGPGPRDSWVGVRPTTDYESAAWQQVRPALHRTKDRMRETERSIAPMSSYWCLTHRAFRGPKNREASISLDRCTVNAKDMLLAKKSSAPKNVLLARKFQR